LRLDNIGQVSAELILVTLVFLIIAVGLIQLVNSEMAQTDTGNLAQARMMGEQVAETINTVYINGNGYTANLTLPNFPNSTAVYSIYVYSNGSLSVVYNSNNINIKLIPTSVQSLNMTNNGTTYIVKNNNGNITFA
jgi:uncharacterized protein (UPF0333 family)